MRGPVHLGRDTWHLAWDVTIPPVAEVASGAEVSYDILDASNGQVTTPSVLP